jgi:glutathione S-transferase
MKLYVTAASPYARIARIVVCEKALSDRVRVLTVKTRLPDSPYYEINPSGRVPYLVRDDGIGMEDSGLIAAYLDQLDGKPTLTYPQSFGNWEYGRLEACARSLLDGLAVLVRELRRPENERSSATIEHERKRSRRIADLWETEIGHPIMRSQFNMAQIVLISAVLMRDHFSEIDLLTSRPHLSQWSNRLVQRPSVNATILVPKV